MTDRDTLEVIRHAALWFEPSPEGLLPLVDAAGDAAVVLIGEASHGTHGWRRCPARAPLLRST
jgi:erythromycin esterase-like protein